MRKIGLGLAGLLVIPLVIGIFAWATAIHEARSLAVPKSDQPLAAADRGAVHFEGAAFGGLSMAAMESHALPWRLTAAALVLDEVKRNPQAPISKQTLDEILAGFGFLVEAQPSNRPVGAHHENRQLPLGFTYADIAPVGGSKLLVANLACSACHAGVTYNENGRPQPAEAWLGMPNTSINLEAYVQTIFEAMRSQIAAPEKLLGAAAKIFPEMGWREQATLKWLVLPIVKNRIESLESEERALPFPNGTPGATNGVAALKFGFKLPLLDEGKGDNGVVSIPDLGGRIWRTSLLADGAYASPGKQRQRSMSLNDVDDAHLQSLADITTFFTVPSMGVHPDAAKKHRRVAADIFTFLSEKYEPQPFPGSVNFNRAKAGALLYDQQCATCHGTYEWESEKPKLTVFPNWIGSVGTDTLRADVFTPDLANAVSRTSYSGIIASKATRAYAAPPLTGIWASAPYLHNGSVPTIKHLLAPQERPQRFMVGGHALDFDLLGIALNSVGVYPSDHQPFSDPKWYDTNRPGHRNEGHGYGSKLNNQEKVDLIEFLKLL